MPAAKRRWTAPEVRQLIAESPLATPRYELVDGERGRPEVVTETLEWNPAGATEAFRLDVIRYFAKVFDEA